MSQVQEIFGGGRHRLVLVASTGGHLAQLVKLAPAHGASDDSVWVTFDSPQSRSLLAGRQVIWVDYVAPRDVKGMIRAFRTLDQQLNPNEFEGVLSTGAAVALAGFWWAKKHRLPAVYIESSSRTDGPSLTGKITSGLKLARTFTQHEKWASQSWPRVESVIGQYSKGYRSEPVNEIQPLKILVSLGTIKPYRFDRLVDRIKELLVKDDQVIWQLGETDRNDLPGEIHILLPADVFLEQAKQSDVVIIHSGMGTILQLLDHGISPIVVPRRKEFGEHVDDHQMQIWKLLTDEGVAVPTMVEELGRVHFKEAASTFTEVKG